MCQHLNNIIFLSREFIFLLCTIIIVSTQRVGCDGVLGSDKIEDECLRCHSPSEEPQATCQRQAAIVTPNQAAMEGELTSERVSVHKVRCQHVVTKG